MAAMGERHVVVTGGGRGIGRAIAERLAADGATLTLLARDLERLRAVADELGAGAAACDIRDRAQVDACFAAAAAERGPIHALVANSGLGGPNEDGSGRPLRRSRRDEPQRHLLLRRARRSATSRRGRSGATSS